MEVKQDDLTDPSKSWLVDGVEHISLEVHRVSHVQYTIQYRTGQDFYL